MNKNTGIHRISSYVLFVILTLSSISLQFSALIHQHKQVENTVYSKIGNPLSLNDFHSQDCPLCDARYSPSENTSAYQFESFIETNIYTECALVPYTPLIDNPLLPSRAPPII